MSQPQEFRFFSSLPAELRLEVWRLSCQPRVVEVRYAAATDTYHSTAAPPAIVQVCQESRAEAARIYRRGFQTRGQEHYIHFCPYLDVLYIPRDGEMGYDDTARDFARLIPDTARSVLSLAIDHVKTDVIRPWEPYNKFCIIQSFPNLQQAFLVVGSVHDGKINDDDDDDFNSGIEFVDPKGDPATILRMIDGVLESFCYELGPITCGLGRKEDVWFSPPIPSLIPKAKVLHGLDKSGPDTSSIVCW